MLALHAQWTHENLQADNFGRLQTLYTTSGHVTHLTPTDCSKNDTYQNQAHPEMGLTRQNQNQAHLGRDEFKLRTQTKTSFHHGAWLHGWLPGQGSMYTHKIIRVQWLTLTSIPTHTSATLFAVRLETSRDCHHKNKTHKHTQRHALRSIFPLAWSYFLVHDITVLLLVASLCSSYKPPLVS